MCSKCKVKKKCIVDSLQNKLDVRHNVQALLALTLDVKHIIDPTMPGRHFVFALVSAQTVSLQI